LRKSALKTRNAPFDACQGNFYRAKLRFHHFQRGLHLFHVLFEAAYSLFKHWTLRAIAPARLKWDQLTHFHP